MVRAPSHLSITDDRVSLRENGEHSAFHRETPLTDRPSGFVVAVVDDEQSALRSLEHLLMSANHAVRLFTSGAALLDSGCLPEIDCLIADIDMPGTDGFELLRLVHAARPRLPTILITADPDALNRLPPLDGIYPGLFTKPFQAEELLAAVSDVLRNSSG
jgi:DNA-binding response OmpR family regulator